MTRSLMLTSLVAAGLIAVGGATSAAEEAPIGGRVFTPIVDTLPPGGFFGYWGFDLFVDQAAAARFTVPADGNYRLARVGIWLMNNSETEQRRVRLMLQTDALDEGGAETLPSGVTLEQWDTRVKTYGWVPVEQFFITKSAPLLKAGRNYWVVAGSMSPPLVDPVWAMASEGNMVTTTTYQGAWQTAGDGAAPTLRVDAVRVRKLD
jgi:hypothetical protein